MIYSLTHLYAVGTIDPLQITREVNNSLIPMLNQSGLNCKDVHMRPSLMRKILKEIGYAQSQQNGSEYFYKVNSITTAISPRPRLISHLTQVSQFDVAGTIETLKNSGAKLLVGANHMINVSDKI